MLLSIEVLSKKISGGKKNLQSQDYFELADLDILITPFL